MYPFRVSGRTIEVCPWRVDYELTVPGEDGEPDQAEPASRLFMRQESAEAFAQRVGGTASENGHDYDWMDGLTIPEGTVSPYNEAVRIAELGEDAYLREVAWAKSTDQAQLRADVDYIMLMGGL